MYALAENNSQNVEQLKTKPTNNLSFIEANSIPIDLLEIEQKNIVPVFSKDNETTISHVEFIQATLDTAKDFFNGAEVLHPQIRVSHPIKGRIPEARKKAANELLEHEKTLYYERMAFTIEIPDISREIMSNR